MLPIEEIEALTYSTTMTKCRGCTNNCRLTVNRFSGGRSLLPETAVNADLEREKEQELPNYSHTKANVASVMSRFPNKKPYAERSVFLVS